MNSTHEQSEKKITHLLNIFEVENTKNNTQSGLCQFVNLLVLASYLKYFHKALFKICTKAECGALRCH